MREKERIREYNYAPLYMDCGTWKNSGPSSRGGEGFTNSEFRGYPRGEMGSGLCIDSETEKNCEPL